MKKILFAIAVLSAAISSAQTLSYNDIGVLFATEKVSGTARYNAMSGAFGSLGGDISAIGQNPAGAAVFLNSEITFSVDFNDTDTKSNYYGSNSYASSDDVNFGQTGGVFVFRNNYKTDGWGAVAVAFDYSKANNFENFWFAEGNSNYPTFVGHPEDDEQFYYYTEGQYFENYTDGRNNKYTFTVASEYNDKIYLGASFISYNTDFYQRTLIEEYNDDNNGNYLDASMFQELSTYGYGYSFNLGIIAKATKSLRLGFAYQSPIWYNLAENFLEEDIQLYYSIEDKYYSEVSEITRYYYDLRTPSKYTGSLSYIFGKYGLISLDYIYKNYSNIELRNSNWNEENQLFKQYLQGTSEVRLGTEWRIQKLSLRGGYHYEQSPYKNSFSSDNSNGFSLGLGYNFGPVKFDVAYQQDSRTSSYDFYPEPEYSEINPVDLDYTFKKFTATLAIKI